MIEFSDHADNQRKRRNIPKHRILQTVQSPDNTRSSYKNRTLRRKTFGSKILEVVTTTEGTTITVITQYYLKP